MSDDVTGDERLQTLLDTAVGSAVTPGAVCQVIRADGSAITVTSGRLASHDDEGRPLPTTAGEPVTAETLYDLASVTKVFTALTVLSLVDEGILDLHGSVGDWLGDYRDAPKNAVTLEHLLSHTSGLPPVWPGGWQHVVAERGSEHPVWQPPGRATVLADILALELLNAPGTRVEYSCMGYITAMAVAETATGMPWSRLVAERVLTPLGLTETTFTPDPAHTAPTEYQPGLGRGMVRGVVHDETAFALEGISGNAGLFATAGDLGRLGHAILGGLDGILSDSLFHRFFDDRLPDLLGEAAAVDEEHRIGFGQSLGLRIGQRNWMGEHGAGARGHTGFTGTSLLVDRDASLAVVLLTNRVHPHRERSDVMPLRAAVADAAYTLS